MNENWEKEFEDLVDFAAHELRWSDRDKMLILTWKNFISKKFIEKKKVEEIEKIMTEELSSMPIVYQKVAVRVRELLEDNEK
mgnify:CR=1 FL=1